jgi:beta-glucosidase
VHASKKILIDLLRTELKFEGVAVTDWEDMIKLQLNHHVAATLKDAVKMSIDAGIDMCMVPNDYDFSKLLIELVKEGKVTEARLNLSVERILKLKKRLGILKAVELPSINDFPKFGSNIHATAARQTAEESITLLENGKNVLPLKKDQRILVTGPAANSMTLLNGAWTRTWQGVETKYDDNSKNTIYESLLAASPSNIKFSLGCELDKLDNVEEVIALSKECDVIVACLGEGPSTEKPGDIDDLELSKAQQQFIQELSKTGKPIVLVLVENRPRIVRDIVEKCAAIILAYEPGDYGGEALASILFGDVNPSGRLPFTYPKFNHSLLWYDHKFTEEIDQQFGHDAFQPQWPFGFGLSYSKVSYSEPTLSSSLILKGEKIKLRCTITNESDREVKEPVLFFLRDEVASVTPSVRKLKDFQKITLPAKGSKEVVFEIDENTLSFINADLKSVAEMGTFQCMIGSKSVKLEYSVK